MSFRRSSFVLVAICSLAAAAKRPLTHQDYDSWHSILSPALSNNGRYLAYGLFPQEGDGVVVVKDLQSGKESRFDAGALPPPPAPDPNAEEPAPPQQTIRLSLTTDSKTLVYLAFPKKADTDKAKKDKKKADEMPKNSLVVVDLATAKDSRVPDVKSYGIPDKGDGYVAYLKEGGPGAKKELGTALMLWDPLESTCRHASLSIL